MSNVVDIGGITRLPLDPDRVLTKAVGKLETALVLGYDKDGGFYFAGSDPSGPENVWLCQMAVKKLLEIGDE